MQNEDGFASTRASADQEWPAQHPALDAALVAAIRAPVADAEFDQQVWARVHADVAAGATAPRVQRPFGAPLWLSALNLVAIGVVVLMVGLALGTAVQPAAQSTRLAMAFIEHSQSAMRIAAVVFGGAGLWLGLCRTPWARAIGLSLP